VAKNRNVPVICEANTLFSASAVPNDPSYNVLYGMTRIQASAAWDISTGSKNVVVAVIDTGVQYTHPDLSANIAVNSGETPNNGVDDDRNGYTDDYYGYDFINNDGNPMDDHYHGTHCAGTVGAKGNNGVGVAGVAWNVSILPVKVLDGYGSGTLASVAAGINYATARGAKILSMSLGGGSSSTTLENAISAARQSGVMIVAAAGNSGLNTDYYPSYPASSPQDNVVAVAATDSSDTKASWSNYGPASVDVAAPGVSIYSTLLGNSYDYLSGTSMATPHVAGMVAVLRSINANLTYLQIKDILIQTSDPVSSLNGKIVSNGRVNLYKAALAAQNGATPSPTPTPTPPVDPTGTPAPTPTEPPADEPTREISIRVERMRRNAYVYGEVTDFEQDTGVRSVRVTLVCNSRVVGTRTTDEDGYYEFAMRRPSTKITCYVEDDAENRSRRLRFR
jgi:subtilisin family serine protease